MSLAKLKRLDRLVRLEQRKLDQCVAVMNAAAQALATVDAQIDAITLQTESTLNPSSNFPFTVERAINRNAYVASLAVQHNTLLELKAEKVAQLQSAQNDVVQQRTRLKGIQLLAERSSQQVKQAKAEKAQVELTDFAINQFLDAQP